MTPWIVQMRTKRCSNAIKLGSATLSNDALTLASVASSAGASLAPSFKTCFVMPTASHLVLAIVDGLHGLHHVRIAHLGGVVGHYHMVRFRGIGEVHLGIRNAGQFDERVLDGAAAARGTGHP